MTQGRRGRCTMTRPCSFKPLLLLITEKIWKMKYFNGPTLFWHSNHASLLLLVMYLIVSRTLRVLVYYWRLNEWKENSRGKNMFFAIWTWTFPTYNILMISFITLLKLPPTYVCLLSYIIHCKRGDNELMEQAHFHNAFCTFISLATCCAGVSVHVTLA